MDPPPPRRAPAQTGHVGLRPAFVDEDKLCGIETTLVPTPLPAGFEDVGAVLLAGAERLFLYVSPIAANA